MMVSMGEMKVFKKTLEKSCHGDRDDGRAVLGWLDAVAFVVRELLELESAKRPRDQSSIVLIFLLVILPD